MEFNEIFQSLQDYLRSELDLALGNTDELSRSKPRIDAYRLTASSYRFITNLMQIYSELIVEMISSIYEYSIATFFILDAKFLIWKAWLETLTALYRFYIMDPRINGKLPKFILDLTDKAKVLYEEFLLEKKSLYEQEELIDKFLEVHSETFDVFRKRLESIVSQKIATDLDAFNQLQKIAFEIGLWMQYTTFEVLSLDRCLYGDKKILVSGIVVSVYKETGLNLVRQLEKVGINDYELQFTSPDLLEYKPLFEEASKHEVA